MNVLAWKGFWFTGAVVGIGWAWIVWSTVRPLVIRNSTLAIAARRLSVGVGATLALPALLLGILQVAGDLPRSDYVYSGSGQNPWVALARAVVVAWYGFVLWWVWSRYAESALQKFGEVLPPWFRKPNRVKVSLSAVIALCVFGFAARVAS